MAHLLAHTDRRDIVVDEFRSGVADAAWIVHDGFQIETWCTLYVQ